MLTPWVVERSAMTQGPGCEKDKAPLVFLAYVIALMGWPWVTNRRRNDVLARSEQLLHGGRDGARWEQQPTSLLPTRGTNVQTDSHPHTCSEFNFKTTARPNITTQSLLSGHWSNSSPINLSLIALLPQEFYSLLWRTGGLSLCFVWSSLLGGISSGHVPHVYIGLRTCKFLLGDQ